MNVDMRQLPDDPLELKTIITEFSKQLETFSNQLDNEKNKYRLLEEQYTILKKLFYGRRSEKLTPEDQAQMHLFNEAEDGAVKDEAESDTVTDQSLVKVKAHTKKKPGRKPIPDSLPREEVIHDLPEDEKGCPCCGEQRPVIGREESEELEIIPAEIKVIKHVRLKYGPCRCDGFFDHEIPEVKTSPMPERMIAGSIAAPGLLAYVLTSKFEDHLPFYRQSKIFNRIDVDISRATMCNWAIAAAKRCSPLIELITDEIRSSPLIQMDETTLKVIHEPDRSKSYMWVAVGYPSAGRRLVLYRYHPSRSETVPLEFLKDYQGYLQTDGYAGYNKSGAKETVTHVGCFAHARRYFHEAYTLNKKSSTAYRGLTYIQNIYKIENDLRELKLSDEVFVEKRKNAAIPVLDDFHNWLVSQHNSVLPESKAGKAVSYALDEWSKLIKYLEHHLLTPDNNAVENAIRPFVLGRKNWLFSNTPRGAGSSAVIFSLIESAKANGLNPYKYLKFLFENLPGKKSRDDLKKLLPNYVSIDELR